MPRPHPGHPRPAPSGSARRSTAWSPPACGRTGHSLRRPFPPGVPAGPVQPAPAFPAAGSPGCSPVRSLPFPCFPWCPALRPPRGPAPAGPVPPRCPVQAPPGSPLRRALRPALQSSQTPRSVRQAARRLPAVPVPWVLPPSGALPCCPQCILPKKPPPRSVSSRRALFSAPVPSRSAVGRWAAPSQPPAGWPDSWPPPDRRRPAPWPW